MGKARDGWQMRAYLVLRRPLQPLMRRILARRIARGKEDPARAGERLGHAGLPRPEGVLVWFHAVGLGEVLALRPLIAAIQAERPGVQVLITSTARSSARVIGQNLPPETRHQFLPMDGPDFLRAFLDHWQPDLAVWSEQDLWPGAVHDAALRGIPLAYVNARIGAKSFRARRRLAGLYRDLLRRFAIITAQDAQTAAHLRALGAGQVRVTGSLKPAAAPLSADAEELAALRALWAGRRIWVAASTHAPDEAVVIPAAVRLAEEEPARLLVLVPRLPGRSDEIAAALLSAGLSVARRSRKDLPDRGVQVYLADTFGDLGLWYRLAGCAFVGGSFGGGGGHNPWEAVCLGLPVISGPDTANFATDYATLREEGLAQRIEDAQAAQALANAVALALAEGGAVRARAQALVAEAQASLTPLARDLVALIRPR